MLKDIQSIFHTIYLGWKLFFAHLSAYIHTGKMVHFDSERGTYNCNSLIKFSERLMMQQEPQPFAELWVEVPWGTLERLD